MFHQTIEVVSKSSSTLPSVFLIYLIFLSLYFLPSIIALIKRNHRTKVILFNFFLGWTFVMWIISLVWACKRDDDTNTIPAIAKANISPAEELQRYKQLLDDGVITEEEFRIKKEQLLGF